MVKVPNSNLILGVGGIIAAVFLVSQIRKAGADVVNALPVVDEGLRQSITGIASSVSSVTSQVADLTGGIAQFQKDVATNLSQFQTDAVINLSQFQADSSQNLKSVTDFFGNLFKNNQTVKADSDDFSFDDNNKPPSEGLLSQEEILNCKCGSSIIQDVNTGKIEQKCLVCQDVTPDFSGTTVIQVPDEIPSITGENIRLNQTDDIILNQIVESELPTDQVFSGGGVSFIGGVVRENPVDTLTEVLNLFPELSASQAADFLNEFLGISPTDALRIDPDIINKVANIGGENIQVPNVSVSDLDAAENRASCTTCELFGLNCERCQIAGLNNA